MIKRLAGGLALAFAGTALTAATMASAEVLRLRYASVVPETNLAADGSRYFAEKVKELSNGSMEIEIFWAGTMGKQEELTPMLMTGALDFVTISTSQVPETPLAGFMNTIFPVFQDPEQLLEISQHLYDSSTGVQAELKRIGGHPVLLQHLPSYQLLCKEPVRTMDDFKGLRIRGYGPYVPLMWQAVGAVPVNIFTTELYDGLSRGVIGCAFLPASISEGFKLQEVAKYLIDVNFGLIEFAPTMVSEVSWQKLTPEQRQIIETAGAEAQAYSLTHIEERSEEAIESLLLHGVELVEFTEKDELFATLPDLIQAWEDRQTAEGRADAAKEITSYVRDVLKNRN